MDGYEQSTNYDSQGKRWSIGNDKSWKPKSRANLCCFYDFLLHLRYAYIVYLPKLDAFSL